MPSFKINSCYCFLFCPGLKGKIFRSQYKWFPVLICCLISSLVAMPEQCPYPICALSNSIICGKPTEYTCSFTGKQKRLQVRFMIPQLLVCQQHTKLYRSWVAWQMMWGSQIHRICLSTEMRNWKESRAYSEATAGMFFKHKL